jgi:dihydroflavonol-4-reductase
MAASGLAVVTGGGGYVGTNLVEMLRDNDEQGRVVDLRQPDTAIALGATWVQADIRDPAAMRRALDGATVGRIAGRIAQ